MADTPEHHEHTCPGSLAICDQVTAQVEGDARAASLVLVFAATIAAIRAGIPVERLGQQCVSLEEIARTLIGEPKEVH
jgi:bifunctional ADP-heptose synthase (sugar kinase/adenylyltransferase)